MIKFTVKFTDKFTKAVVHTAKITANNETHAKKQATMIYREKNSDNRFAGNFILLYNAKGELVATRWTKWEAVEAVEAVEAPKKAKRRACVPVQFIESKGNEVVELGSLTQGEPVKPSVNDVFMKVGDEYVNAGTGEKVPASSVDQSAEVRDYQIRTARNAIMKTRTSKGFLGRSVIVEIQQKPKIVSKYDTEIDDSREFVELFGASFEIYGHIIPPVHARIQHGSAINTMHVLATKPAFKDLKAMLGAGIKPTQFCFIECDCGTIVYVTIDEAVMLGQPIARNINNVKDFVPQCKMNTRLYYTGYSAENLFPTIVNEKGSEIALSQVSTTKVFANNGEVFITECSNLIAMPDHYMVSYEASRDISDYFNEGWSMPFELGFVQTSCGMAVIVTEKEARILGESFLKVKLQD